MGRKEEIQKQKEERLGYEGTNYQGSKFRVVEYNEYNNVLVQFYEHEEEWKRVLVKTSWDLCEKGVVKDKFYPSVYGVGYVGNAKARDENGKLKHSYDKWTKILQRCYDEKSRDKYKTYKGCTVEERWKCFEFFEKDYEELVKENNFPENIVLYLDKDIISKGNKVYSKENCVIVDNRINCLFTYKQNNSKKLPTGVYQQGRNGKYSVKMHIMRNDFRGSINIGLYKTLEEALESYKNAKENYIKQVADEYEQLGYITKTSRLYKAMYSWIIETTELI